MEDYPRTLGEFESRFATADACRAYTWCGCDGRRGFGVRSAEGAKAWPVRTVLLQCAACGRQTSVTAGTIFQDTRTPLRGYRHRITFLKGRKESAAELLPHVHRVVSLLKRWLLGTHQGAVSHAHLDDYLDEFTFRFNRRTSRHHGKLLYRLVQQAVAVDPAPYTSLVKHVRLGRPGRAGGTTDWL